MDIERNFRHAHDLPPMTPPELISDRRVNSCAFETYGIIAGLLLFAIACIALAL